jgi:hypothetical protein
MLDGTLRLAQNGAMATRSKHPPYLEPAHSLIRKFGGPEQSLSDGIKIVAEITGADPTRVYRWMLPKDRGGTGGLVPSARQRCLLEAARKRRLPVEPGDFFGVEAA